MRGLKIVVKSKGKILWVGMEECEHVRYFSNHANATINLILIYPLSDAIHPLRCSLESLCMGTKSQSINRDRQYSIVVEMRTVQD